MFHDDSMKSFFRRLSFTPDGSLLLTPGVSNRVLVEGIRAAAVMASLLMLSNSVSCG